MQNEESNVKLNVSALTMITQLIITENSDIKKTNWSINSAFVDIYCVIKGDANVFYF